MANSTTAGTSWKIKQDVCMFPTWEPLRNCYEGVVCNWNPTVPEFLYLYNASSLIVFFSMRDAAFQGGGVSEVQLDSIFQFFFEPPGVPSPGKYKSDISAFIKDLDQKYKLIEPADEEVTLTQFSAGGAVIPIQYAAPKIEKHGRPMCPDPGAVVPIPVVRCCG